MTTPPPPDDREDALTLALDGVSGADDRRRVRAGVAAGVVSGRPVRVDLSGLDRLSSRTVATILWARRSCALRNLGFSVVGDHGMTRRVLRGSGLGGDEPGAPW
ncbi:STAS domain-containing protein [Phycicoccus sonneratiae]|uniref:STAS domain-containing protein n=1 Tax=Phycicoccus sonneratiae TaxID=2807628 RepID=A0ABS2CR49_9MICO|nr:STAS domain-containing protein [Phycicoccus sonneraticus]MBM6402364.1 STAS domain-containing protein [Phycicoccus sonneraticus]